MTAQRKKVVCYSKVKVINDHISNFAKILGINRKRITTYIARHTWATVMEHNKVPLVYISKGLGHSNITTTTGYLADLNQKQKKEVSQFLVELTTLTTDKAESDPGEQQIATE